MSTVRVLVGTRKGAFILTSDGKREKWDVSGPHFAGWEIYHMKGSAADPNRIYASQTSGWFGQIIQRSDDGGQTAIITQRQTIPSSNRALETQSTRCHERRLHGFTDQVLQPSAFAQIAAVALAIARFAKPNSSWYSPRIRASAVGANIAAATATAQPATAALFNAFCSFTFLPFRDPRARG